MNAGAADIRRNIKYKGKVSSYPLNIDTRYNDTKMREIGTLQIR
jgi:hypothetical protein